MANIEITKLTEIIGAIGKDTIVAISKVIIHKIIT